MKDVDSYLSFLCGYWCFWIHPLCRFFSVLVCASVFFLAGCHKKITMNPQSKVKMLNDFEVVEAKNSDIPVPVGYKSLISYYDTTENEAFPVIMRYEGSQSLATLKNFYNSGMERNGWHIIDFTTREEILLFCSKQGRSCAISVRDFEKNRNTVVIFIKIGKDSSSMMSHSVSKHMDDATGAIELFDV